MSLHPVCVDLAVRGGTASWRELRGAHSVHAIRTALAGGLIERATRDRYVLAGLNDGLRAAAAIGGAVSHRSAALAHGWPVWRAPQRPELLVPRERRVSPARRRGLTVRFRAIDDGDVSGLVTTPLRTVIDCARDLSLTDALAVADSALRSGAVTADEIDQARLPQVHRAAARRALQLATPLSAGPLESALRAISVQAVGPIFVPQGWIRIGDRDIRPDLVSWLLRMVLEADSFEFHTTRGQIRKDCWRHDELLLDDWLSLRFAWDHVMHTPTWVHRTVVRGVDRQRRLLAA